MPFAWKHYSGANVYFLQMWILRADSETKVTTQSVVDFAPCVAATHLETTTTRLPQGSYARRPAAIDAPSQLISTWTGEAAATLAYLPCSCHLSGGMRRATLEILRVL
jgi:hypothetical protein